jgi:hypothetical protein
VNWLLDLLSSLFSPSRPAGSSTETCPLQRRLACRFGSTEVKCGDSVELQADATNIDDGTSTEFAIKDLVNDVRADSEEAPLESSQVRGLNWISKKPTDEWPEDECGLDASADGVTGEGENRLHFHRYPDISPVRRTETMTAPGEIDGTPVTFEWTKKYAISIEEGVMYVRVKIKLLNMQGPRPATGSPQPAVGAAVSTADKNSFASQIQGYLSGKWYFHRDGCQRRTCDCPRDRKCCKLRVRVRVRFVESGEHHVVRLYTGAGRANASEWFRIKTRDNTYAHEVGHLLGFYDEYAGGANGPAPWQVQAGVLMASGARIPNYYYGDFRRWYRQRTGEAWDYLRP